MAKQEREPKPMQIGTGKALLAAIAEEIADIAKHDWGAEDAAPVFIAGSGICGPYRCGDETLGSLMKDLERFPDHDL